LSVSEAAPTRFSGTDVDRHLAQQRAFALEVHHAAVDSDREVEVLVEVRLPTHQLERDAHAILFRGNDHVRLAPLLIGHPGAEPSGLARIPNALIDEPAVDRQHRDQQDEQDGDDSRVGEPKFAPAFRRRSTGGCVTCAG
jgi:hypothetical protein